jgi:hypothetical protein
MNAEQTISPGGLPVRTKWYGVDRALPEQRTLRAGPLTAVLEGGDLRYVRAGGRELVRRLYMAVRDRNWDTIEPVYTAFAVDDRGDGFTVRFAAEHVRGEVDFAWSGEIEGRPDGVIRYEMRGEPRRPFHKNRIGFCVLHPMALAGMVATVTTPEGTVEGVFPERISPHQPFVDMVAIAHPAVSDARCRIAFEGDLFEMEDQRNWTDASYKTYCTPLRIPYPVLVEPGSPIVQSVTISLLGSVPAAAKSGGGADVEVGLEPIRPLPPIGFGLSSDSTPLSDDEVERLRALRPAHLWVQIDLGRGDWESVLRLSARQGEQLGAALELSVVGVTAEGVARAAEFLRALRVPVVRAAVFPPLQEPVVFPRSDLDTNGEVVRWTREAFAAAGLDIPIGGGTRAYFTELNRASQRLPLDEMAWATYTINPQVHAFDNASLVETLEAQTETVASARAVVGDMPLAVGPVTLKQPFNPNATGPTPEPGPDELPAPVDVRQLSLFGAGWTVGSLHRLVEAGADSLTYYETTGWRGLMAGADVAKPNLFPAVPHQLFPLYHAFAALADLPETGLLPVTVHDPLSVEALAVRDGNRVRVLVANFQDRPAIVRLALPAVRALTIRSLDESAFERAASDPAFFLGSDETITAAEDGAFDLRLSQFAVVCLTGQIEPRGHDSDRGA